MLLQVLLAHPGWSNSLELINLLLVPGLGLLGVLTAGFYLHTMFSYFSYVSTQADEEVCQREPCV